MLPEVAEYLTSIESRRTKIFQTLEQADPQAWNWTPTNDETNSLFVLATHVIGSEHGWIYEILGNGAKTRQRPQEFVAKGTSLDALRAEYERVANETHQVLEDLTEADLTATHRRDDRGDVTGRWIILHVIEHSSEHVGQMELTKQLWEQTKR